MISPYLLHVTESLSIVVHIELYNIDIQYNSILTYNLIHMI